MKNLVGAVVVLLVVIGCKQKDSGYPRATVYPRIEIYDTVYRKLAGFPITFYINASAIAQPTADAAKGWADVWYPVYRGTLHLSSVAISPEAEDAEVRNRIERMVMNVGNEAVAEEEFYSPDSTFRVLLFHEPGYTPTPVQFIALGAGRLTSGVFAFDCHSLIADSVAPMINAVVRDIKFSFGNR